MSGWVIDASAALAYLWRETGWEAVGSRLITPGCIIGTVNLAEVIAKAVERGLPDDKIGELRATLDIETITFDDAQAAESGRLRRFTRHLGLSLGNRACLALAITCQATAVTADRLWLQLAQPLGLTIECIRPAP